MSIRLLGLAILTVLAIAACHGKADRLTVAPAPSSSVSTDCRTIEHTAGKTEVCGQPKRIVVLGPYVLEPLLALGVQPAGFADHVAFHQGDYTNPREQIPYLGSRITQPIANVGLAYSPSLEAIIKVQPDLILGTESNANQYTALSKIAPTLLIKWIDTPGSLRTIAQAVHRPEQAEQLLTQTEQRIAAARKAYAPLVAAHPKVLLLVSAQFPQLYLGNSAGLCSSLVKGLGFQLVSLPGVDQAKPSSQVPISLETLPQLNDADLVILLGSNSSEPKPFKDLNDFEEHQLSAIKPAWEKNAIAQSLEASKAKRVYFIPAYVCLGLPGSIGTELYLDELEKQLL